MNIFHTLNNLFRPAQLTRGRLVFALLAALVADGLQIPLQTVPLAPEVIDLVAMVLVTMAIGFHILLLPTFVIELVPLVDAFPTWTGCVLAVIALRKREERGASAHEPPVITVSPPPASRSQLPESNPPP